MDIRWFLPSRSQFKILLLGIPVPIIYPLFYSLFHSTLSSGCSGFPLPLYGIPSEWGPITKTSVSVEKYYPVCTCATMLKGRIPEKESSGIFQEQPEM